LSLVNHAADHIEFRPDYEDDLIARWWQRLSLVEAQNLVDRLRLVADDESELLQEFLIEIYRLFT